MSKSYKTYFGFSEDSEFMKMSYNEIQEWLASRIAIALFKGKFEDECRRSMDIMSAWAIYQNEKKVK